MGFLVWDEIDLDALQPERFELPYPPFDPCQLRCIDVGFRLWVKNQVSDGSFVEHAVRNVDVVGVNNVQNPISATSVF